MRGVDLNVFRRDLLVILGPSGAGKSTLLRVLNRLVDPTEGSVWFDDPGRSAGMVDVSAVSGAGLRRLRQGVGMIFQQFNLVGRLTVRENVLAGRLALRRGLIAGPLSWARVLSRADHEAAWLALEQLGIADKASARADTLSGGQQQRVAIARTLAQEPAVILADEPIASLDPGSAAAVMEALASIRERRGLPVVLNLHQTDVARRYATRVVGLREGRVVFDGGPGEFGAEEEGSLYGREAAC